MEILMQAAQAVAGAAGSAAEMETAAELVKRQLAFYSVFAFLAGAIVLYACGLALILTASFLAPGLTRRGAERLEASPLRALLVGILADAAFVLLVALLSPVPAIARIAAVVVLPVLVILVLGGATVVSQDLGRRAFALGGRPGTRLGRLAAGWGIWLSAGGAPLIGWFVVGPVLLTLGFGGFLLAVFSRAGETTQVPAPPATPDPPAV
jgi:hypothetical protein